MLGFVGGLELGLELALLLADVAVLNQAQFDRAVFLAQDLDLAFGDGELFADNPDLAEDFFLFGLVFFED